MDSSNSASDKAKEIMASLHSSVTEPNNQAEPEKKFVIDSPYKEPHQVTPLENLIQQAHKSNQLIPLGGFNPKPNTYERIKAILKDGGMDSMSQVKSLEKIKEVLSESEEKVSEEVLS